MDMDIILQKFEKYCVGETNETYERHCSNKRDENQNESAYATALRTLAKACNFGQLENDLIRDRIVMGVRDESTRKKLLQVAKFTLSQSIDICRSYETTFKQLESLKAEGVLALDTESPTHPEHQKNDSGVEMSFDASSVGKLLSETKSNVQPEDKYVLCAKSEITMLQCVLANLNRVHESDFRIIKKWCPVLTMILIYLRNS